MTSVLPTPQTLTLEPLGSTGTLEAMYAAYGQRVFRFLLASTRDRDLAETLTQDTFVRAWSAREQFRGECAPATWLTRIALNLLRDHTRTNRFRFWQRAAKNSVDAGEVAGKLPHRVVSAERNMIAREQVKRVWESVAELSERQRTVFLLRFVDEMELPEIAAATGMPLSTVKTHLYRGLAVVRERNTAREAR